MAASRVALDTDDSSIMTAAVEYGQVRFGPDRRWHRFSEPVAQLTVWDLEEVAQGIETAEEWRGRGLWVVGLLSYDAGPAFDAAVVARRDTDVPLLAIAGFDSAVDSAGPRPAPFEFGEWRTDQSREGYAAAIARIHEHIRAGESYQVNYTVRRHASFWGSAEGLAAALSQAQDAEYDAFLHLGTHALCSASPELFFIKDGDTITAKPMKGTRPRHHLPDRDAELAAELLASAKERAENIMIVDMVRNDLGRIARVGSVEAPRLLDVEHYPTVHTMTSTVVAETDAGLGELLGALFPVASITGAPKYRTTEIIADLEQSPRGAYTGSALVLAPTGRTELNVIIRSVWLDLASGAATYGVGGGIVWDSTADAEWHETEHKSRVLARAARPLELLETMAWTPDGGVTLRQRHINRLLRAGDHFGIDVDMQDVMAKLNRVRSDTPVQLRLRVDGRGRAHLDIGPLPTGADGIPVLPLDDRPVDPSDELLHFKTTIRTRYEDARARFPEASDVVLWNPDGEVTETTIANLVFEIDGELVTPPVISGLLPGTLREELVERGQLLERPVLISDLDRVGRVYTINSVRGWDQIEIAATTPPILVQHGAES